MNELKAQLIKNMQAELDKLKKTAEYLATGNTQQSIRIYNENRNNLCSTRCRT